MAITEERLNPVWEGRENKTNGEVTEMLVIKAEALLHASSLVKNIIESVERYGNALELLTKSADDYRKEAEKSKRYLR